MKEDHRELSFVTFKEKSFTIEIYTGANPIEDWSDLVRALLWYLGNENPDMINDGKERYAVCSLLKAMHPQWEDIKKMNQ